jgi:hypothetical protein
MKSRSKRWAGRSSTYRTGEKSTDVHTKFVVGQSKGNQPQNVAKSLEKLSMW